METWEIYYRKSQINSAVDNLLYFIFMIENMKNYEKYIICLWMCVIIWLPSFSIGTWKDKACVNIANSSCVSATDASCYSVSDKYKQSYCITDIPRYRKADSVDNANACIWPIHTNKFSSVGNDTPTMEELIKNYCSSLFWELNEWRIYFSKYNNQTSDVDWQQTFDSHQSLFLHALCSSFKDEKWDMPFINPKNDLLWKVYKWDISKILNLQQMSKWKDLCSLKDSKNLNGCDLSIYVTKIFEWIMSDLFKIKYAQVLHVNTAKDFNEKDNVEAFMSWYFLINKWYKDIKENYTKTISVLQSDQKYYKKVLDSIKMIDNSNLADLAKKSKCSWNIKWMDFVACSLHSSQWKWYSLTPSFVTLVYNEILHYRHFVAYYTYVVQNMKKGTEDEKKLEMGKIWDFQKYSEMQIDAFQLAQHNLEEFSMTYPLHIWLLMDIEKTENFRNDFAKIITIFYSLSEKLQNVQLPQ